VPGPGELDGPEAAVPVAGSDGAPGAAGTAGAANAADDRQAELERLRAEVRDLRARRETTPGPASRNDRGGRWRTPAAATLITIGCLLALVSVLGVWAANQVSNTDRYVANIAPLISEPPIQQALSAKITAEITSELNVRGIDANAAAELARDHLPQLADLLHNFAGPINNAINSFVGTAVARIVASPAMATVWVNANRAAHAGLVHVLSGQGNGSLSVVNGKVVLSLGPFISQAKQQLVAQGFSLADKIPAVNATFPLFEAPNLEKAQQGYRLITTLKWVLPFLSLALLAAGVWIARSRRRGLLGAALGLSAAMLVLAVALAIAREVYLNSVPPSVLPGDAAAALYDTLVRFIKDGLRVLLVIGLVVAAGAFLTGPSAAAVGARRAVTSGIGWLRTRSERAGLRTGPVGVWTSAHKQLLRVAAAAIAALIFVFWGLPPSLAVVIWLVVLLLLALGVIELLGGQAPPSAPPPAVPQQTGARETALSDAAPPPAAPGQ
jgi:hypothetical protein